MEACVNSIYTVLSCVQPVSLYVSNMWEMLCLVAQTNLMGRKDGEGLAADVRPLLHTLWLCFLISRVHSLTRSQCVYQKKKNSSSRTLVHLNLCCLLLFPLLSP